MPRSFSLRPMVDSATNSPTPRPRAAGWLALGLVLVAVLLVLSLATAQFQTLLNSDYLLAHVFAHALGDTAHPISGWNFGSATFWFPDYILYLPLDWLCDNSGLSYPLYAVVIILLIGFTMAWSLAAVGIAWTKAIIATFFGLDLVLLSQGLPGHSAWLWQLTVPAYHGGNVVNGFALLALGLGAARKGRWDKIHSVAVVALIFLAGASNSLFFVHWLAPLVLALIWTGWREKSLRPVALGLVRRAALALMLVIALRMFLVKAQIFSFYEVMRFAPSPALIWSCFIRFLRIFGRYGLFADNWLLWLLGTGGLLAAVNGLRPAREPDAVKRVALLAELLSLLFALSAPIVTNYWADFHSIRYIINWLVVPVWIIALRVCSHPSPSHWLPRLAAIGAIAGAVFAVPQIDSTKLVFPRPTSAQTLRDFCARHNYHEGLSGYWNAHLLTVEWNFDGPRLDQIDNNFFAYFWCNNTFDFFPPGENGPGFSRPAPQFIILNGLDVVHVMTFLKTNNLRITQVGPYVVAVLTPEQTKNAGDKITQQVLAMLQGTRAEWLQTQLPPATE